MLLVIVDKAGSHSDLVILRMAFKEKSKLNDEQFVVSLLYYRSLLVHYLVNSTRESS